MCSDDRLRDLIGELVAETESWDDDGAILVGVGDIRFVIKSMIELQTYRSLSEMRKDVLDADIGHVLGGYAEDELRM